MEANTWCHLLGKHPGKVNVSLCQWEGVLGEFPLSSPTRSLLADWELLICLGLDFELNPRLNGDKMLAILFQAVWRWHLQFGGCH